MNENSNAVKRNGRFLPNGVVFFNRCDGIQKFILSSTVNTYYDTSLM